MLNFNNLRGMFNRKMGKKAIQIFPITFALLIFLTISGGYFGWISVLNLIPGEKILLQLKTSDVLFGLTIYLKTSVDFALIIGILMKNYGGLKNRIAIETGTALGNALGTAIILVLWYFFKEVSWLLALMVIFASLVLFKLAETSLEHIFEDSELEEDLTGDSDNSQKNNLQTNLEKEEQISAAQNTNKFESIANKNNEVVIRIANFINLFLKPVNKFLSPVISKIVPDLSFKLNQKLNFWGLVASSFTIPFILGLDDFAGYVPLFGVVNVFGFGIGVFLGHSILNICLFINPNKTIQIVKNPIIRIIGCIVFIGLAIWGLSESLHILNETYFHLHF